MAAAQAAGAAGGHGFALAERLDLGASGHELAWPLAIARLTSGEALAGVAGSFATAGTTVGGAGRRAGSSGRARFCFRLGFLLCRGDVDVRDFVLSDQREPVGGFDAKRIVFKSHNGAGDFRAVLQANFVGADAGRAEPAAEKSQRRIAGHA